MSIEPQPDDNGHLELLLQFGGDPAEARVFARNGEELPGWQLGPVLADALNELGRDGWRVAEGHLWRRPDSLFPVPVLVLRRPAEVGSS